MGRVIRLDNDVHFMRKELDTLQRKVKSFDVTTEYALSDSDVIAPTTDNWSEDKPSYQTGKFIWVRNTLHTGYGDIILEPYNIGDGQEHILSLTMEYAVSNDAFTEPTGSWVTNAPTLTEGQYLWTRTKIVTNFSTTTTSAIRMTGEKGITGDAISIKGDTGDEGKGYDFIYYTSQYDTAPSTPSRNVERTENVYEAWCDYPCSVTDTYKYTYMSMRTSDNGEWSNWSTPTLMSSIGEKGEDGEGYEIIFRQTKTNTPPTFKNGENLHTFTGTVNGKSFNDNDFVPTDWSDDSNGVNSTYKYEYASTRTKTNGLWSDFSTPSLWNIYSESTYTHIRYSSVNNPSSISQTTTTPTSNTAYIGIYVDKKESETFSSYSWKKWIPMEGIDYDGRFLHIKYSNDEGTTFTEDNVGGSYMGICYSYTDTAPTDPNAYTWSRIRGSDGAGMEFAYYSSATEQSSLSAPTTVNTGTPQVNKWYERPYGVTETVQYCYVSTKPSGGASWGTPVLWAKYGATGQQGGVGERGEDGIGLEQIFCRTDKDGYIVDNTGTRLTINGAVRKLASYTNAQPHTWSAVTTDDYFDETKGWYDNPVGVTENCPFEYVAQRMKTVTNKTNPNKANYKVAVWGKFNVYSQWSNYSEDGVSITGTTVYYAQTTDYTNAPTSSSAWKEGTPQTYEAGKFYWVKQVIHYDNGSSDETAPICVSGVDGQGVHFVYYCGNVIPTTPTDSGSVVPNGSTDSDYDKWVEEPVSPTADDPYLFMSQSTDYNYQTGKWTNFSTPAQIGTYSTDGTTVKTEWRYLTKADTSTPSTSGGGWSTTPVAVTSAKPYCFITSRIVTGNTNGNWSTPVLWSRYANDGDRGTGIFTLTSYTESSASMTGNDKVKYKISKSTITNQIGSITLLVGDQLRTGYYIYPVLASDNTYYYLGEKSNIRGESGASIDSVVNYYLATSSGSGVTKSTSGWTTSVQSMTATKQYLWNYEKILDREGNTISSTNPVIIGRYGQNGKDGTNGKDGVGIDSITEYYAISNSTTAPADSLFGTNVVAPTSESKYLWNYEVIHYSDNTIELTDKRIIGTYGDKGDKGDAGTGYEYAYYVSDSASLPTKPTGDVTATTGVKKWTTVPVNMDSTYKYMYISYRTTTNPTWSNTALWSRFGDKGDTGSRGTSNLSITSAPSTYTTQTGGFTPAYRISLSTVKFQSGVSEVLVGDSLRYSYYIYPVGYVDSGYVYCGSRVSIRGATGSAGASITSVVNYYCASSDGTNAPTSGWTTTIPSITSAKRYLWNYEESKSGDTVISETDPVIIAYYTTDGSAGAEGRGISSVQEYFGISNSPSTEPTTWILDNGSNTLPVMTSTNRYLWNYEKITYTKGTPTTSTTQPAIIGVYGDKGDTGAKGDKGDTGARGKDGIGLEHIFYRSKTEVTSWGNNNTNPAYWSANQTDDYVKPNTGWTDDATGVDETYQYEYCAIRTKTPNSDGTGVWGKFSTPSLWAKYGEKGDKGDTGAKGDKGDTGVSISNVVNHYLATSYTNVQKTNGAWGTWSTSIQTMNATNSLLWNYETIYGDDGSVISESNPVIIGRYGQNGAGIQSITEYYAVSNDNTNAPSDSSFSTSVKTTTTSNRYLWNYEIIRYTDTSISYTPKRVISSHGATGDTGLTGVHGDSISSDTVLDKTTDKNFTDTSIGSVSNSVPSDFIANVVESEAMTRGSARCINSNYITSGGISVYRQGNIATIHVNNMLLSSSFPYDNHTPIFNLPSWAKPNGIVYFPSVLDNSVLSVSNETTPTLRVRWLSSSANMSGTVTYIVDSNVNKLPSSLSWVSTSAIAQGGVVQAKLLGNGIALEGAIIYFRANGLVYARKTNENGIATLNINLASGLYNIVAWYDGGKYDNRGVYEGQIGDYAYAELVDTNFTVSKASSVNVGWGSDDNGYYARFTNSTGSYPIRYHKVSLNINNTGAFNVETDGDGKAHFKLTGLSGSVSVFASIPSSNRITYGASATKTYSL